MNRKKKAFPIFFAIILFIGFFIALQFFFYNVPAVAISCVDGSFVGFTKLRMPPSCVTCIPYCYGEIKIFNEQGDLICENSYKEYSDWVSVPCKELKEAKGHNLTIEYKTEGLNKTFTDKIIRIYNG